jgi:hypothetical protein
MSGGHFGYEQYKIGQIADEVLQLIVSNDEHPWRHFSDATIEEFKRGLALLKVAQIYAQRIDYLVSGDDGEESFHARLKAELGELNQNLG